MENAKKIKTIIGLLFICLFVIFIPAYRVNASGNGGVESYNNHKHNYHFDEFYFDDHSNVSNSYLYFDGENPVRVEAFEDYFVVEKYTPDYTKILFTKTIKFELPLWGGFYCGKNGLFVMYGQINEYESDDFEVIRVVKYDSSWNRKGEVGFFGLDVYEPFYAGSSSFAEEENILHIRTSRLEYTDIYNRSECIHHQKNLYIALDTSTMTFYSSGQTGNFSGTQEISMDHETGEITGFVTPPQNVGVSHSFNQFIKYDGDSLITVDHGDGAPRAITLCSKYNKSCILNIPGDWGENYTGVQVGGLDYSSNNYLVALKKTDFDAQTDVIDFYYYKKIQNVVIYAIQKGKFLPQIIENQLTNFDENSEYIPGNPYIVKISDDRFVVLWDLFYFNKSEVKTNKIQAVIVDGNGAPLSDIKTFDGFLSDCQPICKENTVYWYSCGVDANPEEFNADMKYKQSSPQFYELSVSKDNKISIKNHLSEVTIIKINDIDINNSNKTIYEGDIIQFEAEVLPQNNNTKLTWKTSDSSIASIDKNGKLKAINPGSVTVIVSAGSFSDKVIIEVLSNNGGSCRYEHSLNHVKAKDATCTEKGNSEYWYCTKCGNYYSDQSGLTEIEKDSYIIKATGHKWDKGYVTKEATEETEGIITYTCEKCHKTYTEVIPKKDDPVKAFVTRFYTIILQRSEINEEEIEYYTSRLLSKELDGCSVAKGFVLSPEYVNKGENNLDFVNKMYAAFFNREADDAAYYVNLLEAGNSREVVLAGFVNSPEFKNLCADYGINPGELILNPQNNNNNQGNNQGNQGNYRSTEEITKLYIDSSNVDPDKLDAYVKGLYLQILGRGYDESGLQYWKEQIMEGTTYNAATAARVGFFESEEYNNMNKSNRDFVIDCYHAFLGREPEPDGLAYWTEKLDSGEYSKQKVIDLGFGHSDEFKGILTDCGFAIMEETWIIRIS